MGEIALVTMGQSPHGEHYTKNQEDHILVQGNADIEDRWVKPRVWTTEVTKTACAGDLIITVRAPVGSIGKTAFDVVLGRGVAAIHGNEFLYQFLYKLEIEGYWSRISAGSTFDSINKNDLNCTDIMISHSASEQEKIATFFSALDDLITLHQRK